MNFGSDHRVREAFRATLQGESSSASVVGTQEIDAADVLEVTDLANAIARAEEAIRARSSRALIAGPDSTVAVDGGSEDIFDRLVGKKERPAAEAAPSSSSLTDDAAGPAVHAPYRPTPLPPRTSPIPLPPGIARPATLLRAPEEIIFATPLPVALTTTPATRIPPPAPVPSFGPATQPLPDDHIPPAARTAPMILILDEDAFYHPAGRIRSLADATLDGFQPEPTLMVRLRARRKTLGRVVAAVVSSLALLVLFTIALGFGRASTARPASVATATPAAPARATIEPKATAPEPKIAAEASPPDVPVFDVSSLKDAPPGKPRR